MRKLLRDHRAELDEGSAGAACAPAHFLGTGQPGDPGVRRS